MAISLAAWRQLPLPAALDAACACGACAVDILALSPGGQLDPAQLAEDTAGWIRRIQAELQCRGLTLATLNAVVPDPHRHLSLAAHRERRRQTLALARVAAGLGAKVVSLYPGYHHEGPIQREALIETCAEWVELGRNEGIYITPEIHWKTVAADPVAAAELCAHLPELRLTLDPSHAIVDGWSLADWRPLLPRVVHVHLRDAAPGQLSVPWGHGDCDARAWLTALCEVGYNGYVAIEYLEGDADLLTSLAHAQQEIARMVAQMYY